MFASNVVLERFVLRSLSGECFPFDKTFCNIWWVARIKIRVLKSLRWLKLFMYCIGASSNDPY